MTAVGVHCVALRHVYRVDGAEVIALDDVALDVSAGTTAAVVGPSGSGKSTLMTLLAGLQRPTAGRISIGDVELTRLSERALLQVRAERLAVVAQDPNRNLLPYGDAADNIRFAQRGARGYGRTDLPAPALLLERLGLRGLQDTRADRLSGGERQRLALAAGIASAPGVLLADEPTSQLDTVNRDLVVELLHRINTEFGTTVIAVTHDPEVARRLGRTLTMNEGRLREGTLR
jgi:putative ABC transport system ATP-binding protein